LKLVWKGRALEKSDAEPFVRARIETRCAEEGELAPQNVDWPHIGADQIVANFRIGMTRDDLDAPDAMAVLRVCEQEDSEKGFRRLSLKRSGERLNVARHRQGLLALHAGLAEAFAKARLELLLGDVPEARKFARIVEIDRERDVAYIRTLSAGAWFAERFEGERVPLLAEVLELEHLEFELEVKGLPTPALVSGIVDAIGNAGVAGRVELTGFHSVALTALRPQLPDSRFGLFAPARAPWMTDHLYQQILTHTALMGRFDTVHVPASLVESIDVARLHSCGLRLHAADPATTGELISAVTCSDQLTADDPGEALRLRSELRPPSDTGRSA